jgi:glycosyltransferase involved in cell wall biosynthesis
MEAMASARPVVATRVGGVPELVRDGVDGWLVGPGCATELASAMRACLAADADTLERMGAAARTRALERHDVARSAEIAKGMFDTLAN